MRQLTLKSLFDLRVRIGAFLGAFRHDANLFVIADRLPIGLASRTLFL
jgi:hypothetical protein